eukprot:c3769_g1_i1.p1 GENE.c3769_g1_i1~~c3769_g1_i1.p1  ORF type:complete len:327 (-),score=71.38 c3769_g1_i1:80-1060(-)
MGLVQTVESFHGFFHPFSDSTFDYSSTSYWYSIGFLGLLQFVILLILFLFTICYKTKRIRIYASMTHIKILILGCCLLLIVLAILSSLSFAIVDQTNADIVYLAKEYERNYGSSKSTSKQYLQSIAQYKKLENYRSAAIYSKSQDVSAQSLSFVDTIIHGYEQYNSLVRFVVVLPLVFVLTSSSLGFLGVFFVRTQITSAASLFGLLSLFFVGLMDSIELSIAVAVSDLCVDLNNGAFTTNNDQLLSEIAALVDYYICETSAPALIDLWIYQLIALPLLSLSCILLGIYLFRIKDDPESQPLSPKKLFGASREGSHSFQSTRIYHI